jgi:hypothetical protein
MLLLNQTSFIDNKILNKEYFGTFYIRSLRIDNKKIYILDNNYLQFNSSVLEINKFLFLKKGKLGSSLKVGIYDYKNNLNTAITFKSYILSSQFFLNNYTNDFLNSLKLINRKLNDFKFLFLTHPTKGGFICYSYGFLGFIPKSHCNFFLLNFFMKLKTYVKNKNFFVFYFNFLNKFKKDFSFFNIYSKYFILNVQSFYGLNKFLIKTNKKNFFFDKKKLPKKFKLNFVFLVRT